MDEGLAHSFSLGSVFWYLDSDEYFPLTKHRQNCAYHPDCSSDVGRTSSFGGGRKAGCVSEEARTQK